MGEHIVLFQMKPSQAGGQAVWPPGVMVALRPVRGGCLLRSEGTDQSQSGNKLRKLLTGSRPAQRPRRTGIKAASLQGTLRLQKDLK